MEQEEDQEIQIAIKKGKDLYALLTAKKLNYDAIFKAILDTNNYQRQVMNSYIEANHSCSIIQAIERQFSGNLRDLLTYMFYSPYELDARLLYNAFHSLRTDTKLIIEIFSTRPKWYLELIDQEYLRIYNVTLKSEISKKKREEGKHLDENGAEKIVDEIYKNGLKTYGTNLELFKKVFVDKSREDFILISRIFCKKNPKKINLYQACNDQVGGDNKELLKALVYAICDPSHFFGHNLKKAIVGIGTNTKVLNRILALRSEIDIDVIRERYLGETGRTLVQDIKGDTSGQYCTFLCMLAERNPTE